jgi:hypothetical protein
MPFSMPEGVALLLSKETFPMRSKFSLSPLLLFFAVLLSAEPALAQATANSNPIVDFLYTLAEVIIEVRVPVAVIALAIVIGGAIFMRQYIIPILGGFVMVCVFFLLVDLVLWAKDLGSGASLRGTASSGTSGGTI